MAVHAGSGGQQPREYDDPLDSLLNLEEQYHAEGYAVGEQDGTRAGQVEGRFFGMQRGFERFSELGRLHAQAVVWQSRMAASTSQGDSPVAGSSANDILALDPKQGMQEPHTELLEALEEAQLRPIAAKTRLARHVAKLYRLTEPESLSFENHEKDVAEFDDRSSAAHSTAEVIRRNIGEDAAAQYSEGLETDMRSRDKPKTQASAAKDIEDLDVSRLLARAGPSRRRS